MSKGVLYIFCFCFTVTTYGQSGVVEAARKASEASVPNYSIPSKSALIETSNNVSVTSINERELILSEKENSVIIELSPDIDQYNTIYIISANIFIPEWDRCVYNKTSARRTAEALMSSSLEVVNPYKYNKRAAMKNKFFLRNIKNDKGIYLYLNQTKGKGDDMNSTLILRNSQNEILYKANFVNAGMNEILDVLTSL